MLKWFFRYVVLEILLVFLDLAIWLIIPLMVYVWLKLAIMREYELFMMHFNTILC
jgi:hypothetical protein